MGQAHGGAEPHAVVVFQVLVPLAEAEQLVPADPEAEGGSNDDGTYRDKGSPVRFAITFFEHSERPSVVER